MKCWILQYFKISRLIAVIEQLPCHIYSSHFLFSEEDSSGLFLCQQRGSERQENIHYNLYSYHLRLIWRYQNNLQIIKKM